MHGRPNCTVEEPSMEGIEVNARSSPLASHIFAELHLVSGVSKYS